MCGIKETNLKLQQSLLEVNEKNVAKAVEEFNKIVKSNGIPKVTSETPVILEALRQFESFNKSRNARKITMDLVPAIETTLQVLKKTVDLSVKKTVDTTVKKSKISSEDTNFRLRQRFDKVERNFLKRKDQIKAAYDLRMKGLKKVGKSSKKGGKAG